MRVKLSAYRFHARYTMKYEFYMDDELDTVYMTENTQHLGDTEDELTLFERSLAEAKEDVKNIKLSHEMAKRQTMEHGEIKEFEFETELDPEPLKLDIPEYDYANGHTYDRT